MAVDDITGDGGAAEFTVLTLLLCNALKADGLSRCDTFCANSGQPNSIVQNKSLPWVRPVGAASVTALTIIGTKSACLGIQAEIDEVRNEALSQ